MTVANLAALEANGLVDVDATPTELQYCFHHSLVQEVVYGSLTKTDRRLIHQIVGQVLEETYPDRLEELAPILAMQYDEAGDCQQALKYYTITGKAAQRVYANSEAAAHYRRAIELTRARAGDCDLDDRTLIDLYQRLGRVIELSGKFAEAVAFYTDMEAEALRCGKPSLELAALIAPATIQSTPTSVANLAQAEILSVRAMELARRLDDRVSEAKVLWIQLLLYNFSDRYAEARTAGEAALALARSLDLNEQTAYILNDLASFIYLPGGEIIYARFGMRELSTQYAQKAIKVADEGLFFWLPYAYGTLAYNLALSGETAATSDALQKAMQNTQGPQQEFQIYLYTPMIPSATGDPHLLKGEYAELCDFARGYLKRVQEHRASAFLPDALYYLGKGLAGAGQTADAREAFDQAAREAERLGVRYSLWEASDALAEPEEYEANREVAEIWAARVDQAAQALMKETGDMQLDESFQGLLRIRKGG